MRLVLAIPVVIIYGLVFLTLPVLAQAKKSPQDVNKEALSELEQKVKSLEQQISSLDSRVANSFARLDCDSKKYGEFQFDSSRLVFFAACANIETYLEGHRVTIQVGNSYTFNFRGVKGQLNYGKNMVDSFSKKVDVSTPDLLRSGTWQTLTVIVNPSKAEDMRYLWLELSAETASPVR